MTVVIFDIEASCEDRKLNNHYPMECIEIGAVKIKDRKIVEEFQTFIKPSKVTQLTPFCTNLTGIKFEDLENAPSFGDAMLEFYKFFKDCCIYSCGEFDKKFLIRELEEKKPSYEENDKLEKCFNYKTLISEIAGSHKNLKPYFARITGKREGGMVYMSKQLNIALNGSHHRALDDSKNLANVYMKLQKVREKKLRSLFSHTEFCDLVNKFSKNNGLDLNPKNYKSYSEFFDDWYSGLYVDSRSNENYISEQTLMEVKKYIS